MASIKRLLRHRVTIQRPTVVPPDADDWNPGVGYLDIASDVPALIQERTGREVALTNQQGPVVITAEVFLDPTVDVIEHDRIYHPARARTYEVLYVKDAAGQAHHYQVDAQLVQVLT